MEDSTYKRIERAINGGELILTEDESLHSAKIKNGVLKVKIRVAAPMYMNYPILPSMNFSHKFNLDQVDMEKVNLRIKELLK